MPRLAAPTADFSLPDSAIATAAMEFSHTHSPEVIYNHSVRSYLFARELAAHNGLRAGTDYSDELVFLTCLLHDIGATEHANGDQRFEVDGADAAAAFLRNEHLDEDDIRTVWQAIALHTSLGLAHRFGTVAALSQIGIGADIVGHQRESLRADFTDRVHLAWPRHDLGYALAELVAQQIHDNPVKAHPMTLPGQQHHLVFPDDPHATWFDIVDAAGWGDRPIRAH